MEKPETRLLEEWKANNDLFKFHEELKQKRFAYFLTIQTAFLALFGLLGRETLEELDPLRLFGLVVVSVPPLFIASFFAASMSAPAHTWIPSREDYFSSKGSGVNCYLRIISKLMRSSSPSSSTESLR